MCLCPELEKVRTEVLGRTYTDPREITEVRLNDILGLAKNATFLNNHQILRRRNKAIGLST